MRHVITRKSMSVTDSFSFFSSSCYFTHHTATRATLHEYAGRTCSPLHIPLPPVRSSSISHNKHTSLLARESGKSREISPTPWVRSTPLSVEHIFASLLVEGAMFVYTLVHTYFMPFFHQASPFDFSLMNGASQGGSSHTCRSFSDPFN